MTGPIDITVRMSSPTYITSAVNKVRASNTAGPRNAAEALGHKLFRGSFLRAESLGDGAKYGVTKWRLHCDQLPATGVVQP